MRRRWVLALPVTALLAAALVVGGCSGDGDSDDGGEAAGTVDGDGDGDATADADGGDGEDGTADSDGTGDGSDINAVAPLLKPEGSHLFDMPYPSDLRFVDGKLDLSGFPNPNAVLLIERYVAAGEALIDGFSLTPSIVFRFDGEIDPNSVTELEESYLLGTSILLVDVYPDSEIRGFRYPRNHWWWGEEDATYLTKNTLTVQPLFGTPLRENTTYAAMVLTGVTNEFGEPIRQPEIVAQGLAGEGPLAENYAPLVAQLPDIVGVDAEDIAVATVFTTHAPTTGLREVAAFVQDEVEAPTVKSVALTEIEINKPGGSTGKFDMYEGLYDSPNFQSGTKPYTDSGGDIQFDADGTPIVQEWEELRFAIAVPKGKCEQPENGWPLVMYGHGTGGDWKSMTGGSPYSVATQFAQHPWCIAVMGLDQPLHGTRYEGDEGGEIINSFNFFNVDSARSNFRQSAIDVMYQSRVAQTGIPIAAEDTREGVAIAFDPDNVFFFGHSHGGLSGALFAPFIQNVKGIILSGAGGGLSETTVRRKDILNIKAVLEAALFIDHPDELTISHPAVALMQNLVDITDPLTYAPLYKTPGDGRPPVNLLMFEGTQDQQTPSLTTDNLAAAGRVPILSPAAQASVAHGVLNIKPAGKPVSENCQNDHGKGTAALAQFKGDHFVVFDEIDAVKLYTNFVRTAIDTGTPTIK